MAYRGRGSSPSMKVGGRHSNSGGRTAIDYGSRRVIFIVYDFAYMAIEVILSFAIIIGVAIAFLVGPKIKIVDPIGILKSIIIWFQIVAIIVETCLIMKIAKDSNNGEERLRDMAFLLVGIILIIFFTGLLKIGFKNTYTMAKFEQLYEKDISNGINVDVNKDYYIYESINDYNRFDTKLFVLLIGQAFIVVLNLFYLSKAIHYYSKEKKLKKDDIVVYDDEINIKN